MILRADLEDRRVTPRSKPHLRMVWGGAGWLMGAP